MAIAKRWTIDTRVTVRAVREDGPGVVVAGASRGDARGK